MDLQIKTPHGNLSLAQHLRELAEGIESGRVVVTLLECNDRIYVPKQSMSDGSHAVWHGLPETKQTTLKLETEENLD